MIDEVTDEMIEAWANTHEYAKKFTVPASSEAFDEMISAFTGNTELLKNFGIDASRKLAKKSGSRRKNRRHGRR